jgi:hypothetical protein
MSESERPPLFFVKQLNRLAPCNRAAEDAMKALSATDGMVRIRITRVNRNQRRRAFYWVMLDVAAKALHDSHNIDMDAELLHDTLKRKLKLGEEVLLPSGEIIFRPRSTSDKAMTEIERAAWTDRVALTLSRWLKVEITELMDATKAQHGAMP